MKQLLIKLSAIVFLLVSQTGSAQNFRWFCAIVSASDDGSTTVYATYETDVDESLWSSAGSIVCVPNPDYRPSVLV